jgi:hypothetical protein
VWRAASHSVHNPFADAVTGAAEHGFLFNVKLNAIPLRQIKSAIFSDF